MADSKISALAALATNSIAAGDFVPIVDVSDTSMAASGTTKKLDANDLMLKTKAQTIAGVLTATGLNLGGDTLFAYTVSTWTPVITAAMMNPTLTYTLQNGVYIRVGALIFYDASITINVLSNGGSGEWRFSLPFIAGRNMQGVANLTGVALPANTVSVFFRTALAAYGNVRPIRNDLGAATLTGTNFADGDAINYTGFYFL